ncbi:MAG: YlbF family regulator [Chloroflexota bacterium]
MLSTDINEAAVEFGRALRQAPAVAIYRIAVEALDADPVAQGLMTDLREQQVSLARMQQAGLTPSREQIDRLRLCQAAARGNEMIMAHLRATNEMKAYLPAVAREVSAALGTDYGSLVAPTSC